MSLRKSNSLSLSRVVKLIRRNNGAAGSNFATP